jgi:hypothetical protein
MCLLTLTTTTITIITTTTAIITIITTTTAIITIITTTTTITTDKSRNSANGMKIQVRQPVCLPLILFFEFASNYGFAFVTTAMKISQPSSWRLKMRQHLDYIT